MTANCRMLELISNDTSFEDQRAFVIKAGVLLFVVRFLLSGTQSAWTASIPNPFASIGRLVCKPGKDSKFAENAWFDFPPNQCRYTMWHTLSFVVLFSHLVSATWAHDFFFDVSAIWYKDENPNTFVSTYYLTQFAFWSSCLAYCLLETWRKDTLALILHHLVTLGLLALSWSAGMWKMGLLVLALHDFCDIILYLGKVLSYSLAPQWMCDRVLEVFAVSFLFSRLLMFPYYCIYSSIIGLRLPLDPKGASRWMRSHETHGAQWAIVVLASTLLMLHMYWFSIIVRMAVKVFLPKKGAKKQVVKDVRSLDGSDKEDQSEGEDAAAPAHEPRPKAE